MSAPTHRTVRGTLGGRGRKLTDEQRIAIRRAYLSDERMTYKRLAFEFGVSITTVQNCVNNFWRDE